MFLPGHGPNNVAIKSWWLLDYNYRLVSCGANYGRWTEHSEREYLKRLAEIERGGQPLGANAWRNQLRGLKEVRSLKASIAKHSDQFLRQLD